MLQKHERAEHAQPLGGKPAELDSADASTRLEDENTWEEGQPLSPDEVKQRPCRHSAVHGA